MGDALDEIDGGNSIAIEEERVKWIKKNEKREAKERKEGKIPTIQIRSGIGSEGEMADRLNEVIELLNKITN